MSIALYDKLGLNADILLDLPFREGAGALAHDVAKPHHTMTVTDTGTGSYTWGNLASGYPYIDLSPAGGGATQGIYLSAVADDLNFTSGDYSIGGWFNWTDPSTQSAYIMNKGEVSVSGWEVYLTQSGALRYLTLRHSHEDGASTRTATSSTGWAFNTWWFFGISRSGASALHYRNGIIVTGTVVTEGGLIDPKTDAHDLVIAGRYTKDAVWYYNMLGRLRFWGGALTATDWMNIYQLEKGWFE